MRALSLATCVLAADAVSSPLPASFKGVTGTTSDVPCIHVPVCVCGPLHLVYSADGVLLDVPEVSVDGFLSWVSSAAAGLPYPGADTDIVRCGHIRMHVHVLVYAPL